jgi:VIT1/CCC1 family predicted Fe2+/Mn2+ transporter
VKTLCEIYARNPEAWVSLMMAEELGLIVSDESPIKNALVTFISFELFGITPIIPFIIGHIAGIDGAVLFYVSTILTAVFLFVLGVTKSMFSSEVWYKSGIETLIVGAFAAVSSFIIGYLLNGLGK